MAGRGEGIALEHTDLGRLETQDQQRILRIANKLGHVPNLMGGQLLSDKELADVLVATVHNLTHERNCRRQREEIRAAGDELRKKVSDLQLAARMWYNADGTTTLADKPEHVVERRFKAAVLMKRLATSLQEAQKLVQAVQAGNVVETEWAEAVAIDLEATLKEHQAL